MLGFFKNRTRKRLLEQAAKARVQKAVFPDMRQLGSLGILYKIEFQEDLEQLHGLLSWIGEKRFGMDVSVLAVEVAKCFKEDQQRESYEEELKGKEISSGRNVACGTDKEGAGNATPGRKSTGGKDREEAGRRGGLSVSFVGKKNLTQAGVPEGSVVEEFLQRRFDMLVVLGGSNFTMEYLALRSDSAFVVGMENCAAGHYDMVLAPGADDVKPQEYLQQLFEYLENMNSVPQE